MILRKNTITLQVLSAEDISEWELGVILEACDTGPCVMGPHGFVTEVITREQMDAALIEAGSDPEFFSAEED